MNIVEALDDPKLLGAATKDPAMFRAWRPLFEALFGFGMDGSEVAIYRADFR